jgi:hypothetical protein
LNPFFYANKDLERSLMTEPYQRQKGDFEIRILPDGRLVFVAPDEQLAEVAGSLECTDTTTNSNKETIRNARRDES